ncbi:MAG: peptide chain release factor N(5)-glutamine methyltransferase [Planctomycetota bacterium]|nr:peptide chain release factor N(5)-glutamine methyltransferase [Planctomycetota bacterium]MDP6940586.1 peptide chain release factor N(5)-glutamine methyltransferase [Planctomycetota bacterium]
MKSSENCERLRSDVLRFAESQLKEAGSEEPHQLAEELWLLAAGCTRTQFLLKKEDLTSEVRNRFELFLSRALKGEPLAYIEGVAPFYGFEFEVNPHVLVPRADSECLIDLALEITQGTNSGRCIDFGTGSGCLLLSFLSHRPKWKGVGVDICDKALAVAERNSNNLGLTGQCDWLNESWDTELNLQPIELLIANPPYVFPGEELGFGVQEHEPALALFTPPDNPMNPYQHLLQRAKELLSLNGNLLFEVGAGRTSEVRTLCEEVGFVVREVRKDLGGIERVIYASRPASI